MPNKQEGSQIGHVDYSRDEMVPKYDWKAQIAAAENIIAFVKVTRMHRSGADIKPVAGLDLSEHCESIARLLATVAELYDLSLEDFQLRCSPNRPLEKLEANYDPNELGPHFDYGAWTDEGFESWGETWRRDYGKGRGRPGYAMNDAPPTKPLYGVYAAVRDWWRDNNLGQFSPTCKGEDVLDNWFTNDSAFLLGVLQYLDKRYQISNARGLYETMRKRNP